MKTQRQRDGKAQDMPLSEAEGPTSVGAENGPPVQNEAGLEPAASPAQPSVPQLPKRKAQRTAAPTEPGGDGAGSSQVATKVQSPKSKVQSQSKAVSDPVGAVREPPLQAGVSASVRETPAGAIGRAWSFLVTYENAFYLAIFVLAIVSRFYDLGTRALHHDESLHAVYGRNLYSGAGYQHDPMMHGPEQFHFIAVMFWLFGTSDATARFASVVCGIIVVMSPFFLRRQMGRLPALICSILFLVSPSVLYFSRMAREDAIFSGMETIMIIGLWRFLSTRRPADFYIFCAGMSLMFTIKETAYLTFAVLGVFFLFLFAYQAGYAILGTLFGYLAVLGGVELYFHGQVAAGKVPALPNIPNTNPDYDTIVLFARNFLTHPQVLSAIVLTIVFIVAVVMLFRSQNKHYARPRVSRAARPDGTRKARSTNEVESPATAAASEVSTNGRETPAVVEVSDPPVSGAAGPDGASGNGLAAPPDVPAPAPEVPPLWNPKAIAPKKRSVFAHYEQGSLPYTVGGLLARPSVLLIGLAIAATIFVVLYSVFFSDVPRGIASGLFASLGYWIAQQGVKRGGQPWFFYFLLIPLYEPIAVFFSVAAGIFFSWRGIRWLRKRRVFFRESWLRWALFLDRRHPEQERREHLGAFNTDRTVPFAHFSAFLPLFIGTWLVGVFILYSWAGEKMPWLMMHMTRPAIYLASLFIGALAVSLLTRRRQRLVKAGLVEEEPRMAGGTQTRRPLPAGARFTLTGVRQWAEQAGLVSRKLAYEGVPSPGSRVQSHPQSDSALSTQHSALQFSMGRGGRGGGAAAGAMRRPGSRGALPAQPVYSVQEPPWVSWNRPDSVFPFASYVILFIIVSIGWGLSMSQQTYDVASRSGNLNSWGWTWFFPFAMAVITVSYAVWLGVGRALRYLGVGIFSVMLLYQFHSGFTLSYRQPDGAQEMAVYVQTSPDVTRVMRELQAFSYFTTGAKDVKVLYDSEVSWPFEWYLGDYPNKQFVGGSRADPAPDVSVMFVGYTTGSANYSDLSENAADDEATKTWKAKMRQNWTIQRYALRWWFPEEWYKNRFLPNLNRDESTGLYMETDAVTGQQKEAPPPRQLGDALQTIVGTVTVPENQSRLWTYLMYKEPPNQLGSTDFMLYIRKDAQQLWHYLQYQPISSTDVPVKTERSGPGTENP